MTAPAPRTAPPRAAVAVLIAAVAVVGSNSLVLSPILGDVGATFGVGPGVVARAIASYGAATAVSAFFLGPQIDRFGARRALFYGLLLLLAATLWSAFSVRAIDLVLAQALAGVGGGLTLPSAYALAAAIAPPGLESRTLGRVLTGWSVALVGGVPAAAWLADAAGWRASYVALATLAAIALLGAARLPVEGRGAGEARARGPGALVAPLRFAGVPALLAACLCYMAAFYAVYAFLPDHLRTIYDASAGTSGLVVLVYGVGFAVASLGDSRIDRADPRRLFPVALGCVACVYLALPVAAHAPLAIGVAAAAWGFFNHFSVNMLILLLTRAAGEAKGAVLGLYSATTYLGATAGVAAAGFVYDHVGFPPVSYAAAVALALGAGIAWRAARPRTP